MKKNKTNKFLADKKHNTQPYPNKSKTEKFTPI